jgi:hypothetical protein
MAPGKRENIFWFWQKMKNRFFPLEKSFIASLADQIIAKQKFIPRNIACLTVKEQIGRNLPFGGKIYPNS